MLPDGTIFNQKERFYKVKSYVGLVAPKHLGGKILSYKICYGIIFISITPSKDKLGPLEFDFCIFTSSYLNLPVAFIK